MEFMITFNHVDGVWDALSDEARDAHQRWLDAFVQSLREEKGAELVFLTPAQHRTHVRKHDDGRIEHADGPAIPGSEQIGGYWIMEADSIDEAMVWAERGRWLVGSNEVRQIFRPRFGS